MSFAGFILAFQIRSNWPKSSDKRCMPWLALVFSCVPSDAGPLVGDWRLHVHALPAHACAWDVRWAVPSCHGLDIWLNRGAAFRAGSLLVFNLQLILNAPKLLACSVSRLSTISLPRIVLGRLWGSPDFILVPKNNRLALSCCITHHMECWKRFVSFWLCRLKDQLFKLDLIYEYFIQCAIFRFLGKRKLLRRVV